MGAESEVGSLEPEEERGRALVCGSAAGNGGGMVRHSHGARGLRSEIIAVSHQQSAERDERFKRSSYFSSDSRLLSSDFPRGAPGFCALRSVLCAFQAIKKPTRRTEDVSPGGHCQLPH